MELLLRSTKKTCNYVFVAVKVFSCMGKGMTCTPTTDLDHQQKPIMTMEIINNY